MSSTDILNAVEVKTAAEASDVITALPQLVVAFGPVGAALLLLIVVMMYFYRRDFMRKQDGLKEAHERRDRREEMMAEATQGVAVGLARLTDGIAMMTRSLSESQDRLARDLADAIREMRRERGQRDDKPRE